MLQRVDDESAKLGVGALDLGEGLRCLVSPDLSGAEDAGFPRYPRMAETGLYTISVEEIGTVGSL